MSDLKTQPSNQRVDNFLNTLDDHKQKEDSVKIVRMMQKITGFPPVMWGGNLVGFGTYHYKYASGREGDWFITGFSPRTGKLSIYIMSGFAKHQTFLEELGECSTGKSCLYIKRLRDIDEQVLEQLIQESVEFMKKG